MWRSGAAWPFTSASAHCGHGSIGWRTTLQQLYHLIRRLKPIDRDVMLLYLEGIDGEGIAEVLGISVANVAQKIHRSKKLLQQRFEK